MGGGSSAKGNASTASNSELANSQALGNLATTAGNQSSALFNTTFPGLQSAENFEGTLSTGDPYALARAAAPADQQISAATTSARQNILNNAPAGGEKNLALEQTNVNQGAQTGSVASQGYLNSFNSLAQLGAQGAGLSNSAAATGIGALGTANSGFNQVFNQGVQQKGASLAPFGALGQLGGQLGSSAITAGKGG